jgi:hypothetical protein
MRLFFISCLLVLVACHHAKKEKPYRIIPEDKFVKLLIDYHIAEGEISTQYFRERTKKFKTISLCDSVVHLSGYTKAELDSTISFYSANPDKYDLMYEKIITELSRMQAEAQDLQVKKQQKLKKK